MKNYLSPQTFEHKKEEERLSGIWQKNPGSSSRQAQTVSEFNRLMGFQPLPFSTLSNLKSIDKILYKDSFIALKVIGICR